MTLTSTLTLRPSGTARTISSARTVSVTLRASARGNSKRESSLPSARRTVSTSGSCSAVRSGSSRPSTILLASRLKETGAPLGMSKTATPTGEVSIRVSRPVLARCSSRCRRALETTRATWEANMTRVSSSSWVNSPPSLSLVRLILPTLLPR